MIHFKCLFSKTKIGNMALKNRIAFGEIATGGTNGHISKTTTDFYVERARGGVGLIMVGGISIDISGAIGKYQARIDDDKYIPALKELVRLVHEASPGIKIGVELMHVGRQMNIHSSQVIPGMTPVSPSAGIKYLGDIEPRELTIKQIQFLESQYIEAAKRVKEAGFDCVELHGAHGYLINQFLSPFCNERNDRYGGTLENRVRFSSEIIQGIKQKCGKDFPVLMKINVEDYMKQDGAITLEYAKTFAPLLAKAGVDELHVTCGQHESYIPATGPYMIPRGVYADFAAEIKGIVNIPVGVINRINDPVVAEHILSSGKADIIWMTRALIADPEFPDKAAEGRVDEIRTCIACNTCIDLALQGHGQDYWKCAINPHAHRESSVAITKTLKSKRVLIVGGGPAGMEAARTLALIGHNVTLWEKGRELGGQLILAAMPPHKEEFNSLTRYYSSQLNKLGVKVELRKEATATLVKELLPDAIIIATGSNMLIPKIPGVRGENVVSARDVLAGKAKVGNRVIVLGGGEVGLETAQFLAAKGKKVTIIEMLPELGKGMVRDIFNYIREQLEQYGTKMLADSRIEEITGEGAIIKQKGRKRQVRADTVVLATGAIANRELFDTLQGIAPEIYLAGDCQYPGNIRSAIFQGAYVALMLD